MHGAAVGAVVVVAAWSVVGDAAVDCSVVECVELLHAGTQPVAPEPVQTHAAVDPLWALAGRATQKPGPILRAAQDSSHGPRSSVFVHIPSSTFSHWHAER